MFYVIDVTRPHYKEAFSDDFVFIIPSGENLTGRFSGKAPTAKSFTTRDAAREWAIALANQSRSPRKFKIINDEPDFEVSNVVREL